MFEMRTYCHEQTVKIDLFLIPPVAAKAHENRKWWMNIITFLMKKKIMKGKQI